MMIGRPLGSLLRIWLSLKFFSLVSWEEFGPRKFKRHLIHLKKKNKIWNWKKTTGLRLMLSPALRISSLKWDPKVLSTQSKLDQDWIVSLSQATKLSPLSLARSTTQRKVFTIPSQQNLETELCLSTNKVGIRYQLVKMPKKMNGSLFYMKITSQTPINRSNKQH